MVVISGFWVGDSWRDERKVGTRSWLLMCEFDVGMFLVLFLRDKETVLGSMLVCAGCFCWLCMKGEGEGRSVAVVRVSRQEYVEWEIAM